MYWSSSGELQGSKDGGKTWYPIYSSPTGEEFIAHPTKPGVIYGVAGAGPSVLVSWDGGRSWQKYDTYDDCDAFQRVYFAGGGSQVVYANGSCPSGTARSEDDGHSWQVCANLDTEKKISRSSLVIDPRDSDHTFLATRGGGIKSSTDGCQSWQDSNNGLGSLFINSIALDPNNPDIVYTGTDNGAYVSYDNGGHWGQVNDGLLGAIVVYSIVVDKDGNVYAATPYGIFKLEGK